MGEKVRDGRGKYSSKVTRKDILNVFDRECSRAEPMLKTSEIVDALRDHFQIDVSGETVRRHLKQMEGDEEVASKKFGARAKGWTSLVNASEVPRDG